MYKGSGMRAARRILCGALGLVLLCGAPAGAQPAGAQPPAAPVDREVVTSAGVRFSVPGRLRLAPELSGYPGLGKLEQGFTDGASSPLHVMVFQGPRPAIAGEARRARRARRAGAEAGGAEAGGAGPGGDPRTLHAQQSERLARAFTRGLRRSPEVGELRAVTPVTHDGRGERLRIGFTERSGSPAHALLAQPDTGRDWQRVRALGGGDGATVRCYLTGLLGGAASATPNQLALNVQPTAGRCGVATGQVQGYLDAQGPAFFSAFDTRFVTVAFFGDGGLVLAVVVAPHSRAADAEAVADRIWASARVDSEPLEAAGTTGHSDGGGAAWQQAPERGGIGLAGLLGATLGAGLGALLFGWLLAGLAHRLGAPQALVVPLACGCLILLALGGMLVAGGVTPVGVIQLVSYVVVGLLVRRPLLARLAAAPLEGGERGAPGGARVLSDQRGLTTMEYAILFVVLCAGGLATMQLLGASQREHVQEGSEAFDDALNGALGDQRGPSDAPPAAPAVRPGQRGGARPAAGSPGGTPSAMGPSSAAATSSSSSQVPSGSSSAAASSAPPAHAGAPGVASSGVPPNAADPAPSLLEQANGALEALRSEYPMASTIVEEGLMMLAEGFIPGVGAAMAIQMLMEPDAAGWEKALAVGELVASLVPGGGAAAKLASKGVGAAVDAYQGGKVAARAAKHADEAAQATQAARSASRQAGRLDDGAGSVGAGRQGKRADGPPAQDIPLQDGVGARLGHQMPANDRVPEGVADLKARHQAQQAANAQGHRVEYAADGTTGGPAMGPSGHAPEAPRAQHHGGGRGTNVSGNRPSPSPAAGPVQPGPGKVVSSGNKPPSTTTPPANAASRARPSKDLTPAVEGTPYSPAQVEARRAAAQAHYLGTPAERAASRAGELLHQARRSGVGAHRPVAPGAMGLRISVQALRL